MINDVLMRIQPDAKVDVRQYVMDELDKLNRELSRMREVAGAETARRTVADAAERGEPDDEREQEALQKLVDDLRAIAANVPTQTSGGRRAIPREVMLFIVQEVVNAGLARFHPRPARGDVEADRDVRDRAARLLLALQSAQAMLEVAETEIEDARQGVRKRKHEVGRTRRRTAR